MVFEHFEKVKRVYNEHIDYDFIEFMKMVNSKSIKTYNGKYYFSIKGNYLAVLRSLE